jgi:hypothetical protein
MYLNDAAMGDSEAIENCRNGHDFGVARHLVRHAGCAEPDERCEGIHDVECNTASHGMPTVPPGVNTF